MTKFTVLCAVMLSGGALADVPCQELERGFEKFDNKKSEWVKTSELVLLNCGGVTRLELRQGSKLVDSTVLPAGGKGETWALDGLACGEKSKVPRQHAVLSASIEKPAAVWAANPKTNKLEALDLKTVTCSKDEP